MEPRRVETPTHDPTTCGCCGETRERLRENERNDSERFDEPAPDERGDPTDFGTAA